MSSYKKSLILCSALLFLSGCSSKTVDLENKQPEIKKIVEIKTKNFDLEN